MRSLAHDLKTPLTISRGYLEEIEDGLVTSEQLPQIIQKLKKENIFIDDLCSDILSYQQSLLGVCQQERINLDGLLKEVCDLLRLEITISILGDDELYFAPLDLKKILLNLLHNAKKFATGEITVQKEASRVIIQNVGRTYRKHYKRKYLRRILR